jgi:hypothetical protein
MEYNKKSGSSFASALDLLGEEKRINKPDLPMT